MYRALGFLLSLLLAFPALGDVVVKSGASTDQLTVDATSKALRATLYDSTGQELLKHPDGSYMLSVEVRHTGAAAANTTIFDMRGPTTKVAYIKRIHGMMCFDGTGLAASGTMRIGMYRGTGAASASAGAVTPAVKKDSTDTASTLADARAILAGTGLTTTGITYEASPFYVVGRPAMAVQVAAPATSGDSGGCTPFEMRFCEAMQPVDDCLMLRADEHLAIRQQTVAAIVGLTIFATVEWAER